MTPERIEKIRALLRRKQTDLTVITDFVHKPRNISAILRNCDAVAMMTAHIVSQDKHFRAFRGTASGSHQWIEIARHKSVDTAVAAVKAQGMQIVAAHVSDATMDYDQVDYTQPTAIMFGAEKEGLSDQGIALADHHIMVPMQGMVESYNVSVASGIIFEEARKQRQRAGMYEYTNLSLEKQARLYFEWAYPHLARYCKDKRVEYPPVDEEGYLLNPSDWYQKLREARS